MKFQFIYEWIITGTDQAVFIRSLTQTLFARRNKVAENVTKFMDKFKEHFSNSSNFLKALSPTTVSWSFM